MKLTGYAGAIRAEQEYVTMLYALLDQARERSERELASVRARGGAGGTHQARLERDVSAAEHERRIAQLNLTERGLCFGRTDDEKRDTLYIGRIGLRDDDYELKLIDWRAPAARPFYAATPRNPVGLVRRRHIYTRQRTGHRRRRRGLRPGPAVATKDRSDAVRRGRPDRGGVERAHRPDDRRRGHHPGRAGPGDPRRPARRAGRPGRPGHRQDGRRAAPRRLPALHPPPRPGAPRRAGHRPERRRSCATSARCCPRSARPTWCCTRSATCSPACTRPTPATPAAVVKGDERMVRVLQQAVRDRQRCPRQDVTVDADGVAIPLRRAAILRARDRARATRRPHNVARKLFVDRRCSASWPAAEAARPRPPVRRRGPAVRPRAAVGASPACYARHRRPVAAAHPGEAARRPAGVAASDQVRRRLAPSITRNGPRLARPDHPSRWTVADVPLLDEAAELLGVDDSAAAGRPPSELERAQRLEAKYAAEVLDITGLADLGMIDAETLGGLEPGQRPGAVPPPSAPRPTAPGPTATSSSTRRRSCPRWPGGWCCAATRPAR